VLVVVGQACGFRWEFGVLEMWVEGIVRGAEAREEQRKREDGASGDGDVESGSSEKEKERVGEEVRAASTRTIEKKDLQFEAGKARLGDLRVWSPRAKQVEGHLSTT